MINKTVTNLCLADIKKRSKVPISKVHKISVFQIK